jgi:hypothetical protein
MRKGSFWPCATPIFLVLFGVLLHHKSVPRGVLPVAKWTTARATRTFPAAFRKDEARNSNARQGARANGTEKHPLNLIRVMPALGTEHAVFPIALILGNCE